MDDHDDSVMVALLPITSDWSKLELPHLTLVYAGKKADLQGGSYNDLVKDAASIAMMSPPITLRVMEREVFGKGMEQVDVLRLRNSSELMAMRNVVESWDQSEWPFNPHVTVGPVGSSFGVIPAYIAFDRIAVVWGNNPVTFWLRHR